MTNEIFKDELLTDELLTDEQLDDVTGGNAIDRAFATAWIVRYYGSNGTHGQIVDTSNVSDTSATVKNFCDKAGVEWKADEKGLDQFKINGEWRDAVWMACNKETTLAFFDKQLGIK